MCNDQESGRCYTVSEFVEGENAAALIRRIGIVGMLDWRTTLRIGRDLCAALVFASEQEIVHRHITPQNILIRKSDGAALPCRSASSAHGLTSDPVNGYRTLPLRDFA